MKKVLLYLMIATASVMVGQNHIPTLNFYTLAAGSNHVPSPATLAPGTILWITDAQTTTDCSSAGGGILLSFCYVTNLHTLAAGFGGGVAGPSCNTGAFSYYSATGTTQICNPHLDDDVTRAGTFTYNDNFGIQAKGFDVIGNSDAVGQYLRNNGTKFVVGTIQVADVPTLNQNTTGTAGGLSGAPAISVGAITSSPLGGVAGTLLCETSGKVITDSGCTTSGASQAWRVVKLGVIQGGSNTTSQGVSIGWDMPASNYPFAYGLVQNSTTNNGRGMPQFLVNGNMSTILELPDGYVGSTSLTMRLSWMHPVAVAGTDTWGYQFVCQTPTSGSAVAQPTLASEVDSTATTVNGTVTQFATVDVVLTNTCNAQDEVFLRIIYHATTVSTDTRCPNAATSCPVVTYFAWKDR
jgi:hypothetical protein